MGIKNLAYSFFIFFGFLVFSESSYSHQFYGCSDYCKARYDGNFKAIDNCIVQTQKEGKCGPGKPVAAPVKRPAAPKPQENRPAAAAQADKSSPCKSGEELVPDGVGGGNCQPINPTSIPTASNEDAKTACTNKGGKPDFNEHDGYGFICVCKNNPNREFVSEANCLAGTGVSAKAESSDLNCPEVYTFKAAAESCNDEGVDAVKQCDKDAKGVNENYDTVKSFVGMAAQAALAKGAKAGSAEACHNAGTVNAGAFYALNGLKETCENEITECKNKCDAMSHSPNLAACVERFKSQNGITNESLTPADQEKVQEYYKKVSQVYEQSKMLFSSGKKECEVNAKKNENDIGNLMNNMNNASKQAAMCECQLTAGQTTGGKDCSQMPGPADCIKDPSNVLCQKFPVGGGLNCTGQDRDSKQCICLRDPKAASCLAPGPNTGSQVAAVPGFQPINGASPNYKGSTGGGFNLDGLGDDEMTASGASGDRSGGGDPIGSVSPSGGGSGGGAMAGGADKEEAHGEEESKSGVGGLFNQLKTGVSQLFGGGKKDGGASGKSYGDGKNKNALDPEKWRPKSGLRGVAGGNIIGGRNEDIFKKMNNQYNYQKHTFISGDVSPR